MIFEIGKLYKCTSHYLLIYPSKEKALMYVTPVAAAKAMTTSEVAMTTSEVSRLAANYWSKKFNCKVSYSVPNEPFMVLEDPEKINGYQYINVLFGNKIGWILYNKERTWLKIERIS